MKLFFLLLSLGFGLQAAELSSSEIEARVESDLEKALIRLIPEDQFVLHVNADITERLERRLVEGEALEAQVTVEAEPVIVPPMPGFVPDTREPEKKLKPQSRQVYRMESVKELRGIKAELTFDEALEAPRKLKAKEYITHYLRNHYPGKSSATFLQIPMLKKKVADPMPPAIDKPKPEALEKPKAPEWKDYAIYGVLGLLGLISVLQLITLFQPKVQNHKRSDQIINFPESWAKKPGAVESSAPTTGVLPANGAVAANRKKLLESFLRYPAAFRQYFQRLSSEEQAELTGALKGPAFTSLLESLHLPLIAAAPGSDSDTAIEKHLFAFTEFSEIKDWENQQFFGFLNDLRQDQLQQLVARENAKTIAVMLRFMKPAQSAVVLESIDREKRLQVVGQAAEVNHMPWSELSQIEKENRTLVSRLALEGTYAPKDEVTFWGSVISESHEQDSLLTDISARMPEMAGKLTKFRFRLEDAATLPDAMVTRVLEEVDNDELTLALHSCSDEVVEVLLAEVPLARRKALRSRLAAMGNPPKESLEAARQSLTRRFREAIA